MKALVLTAGLGRRMQPLSKNQHKTLLEIAPGQTILGRIVESLVAVGIDDIVVVTGYRANEVEEYLRTHFSGPSFTFVENSRYADTNNIHSMALAFESVSFDDGVVLVESDLIYDSSVLATLFESPEDNVALVDTYRPGMDGTVVRMDDEGIIVDVVPGSRQGAYFDFSTTFKTLNVYRFSGEFCNSTFAPLLKFYARAIDDNCYYELILGMLISIGHAKIHGVKVPSGSWAEVDDPVDLHHARFMADPAHRRELLDRAWGGYWGLEMVDFAFIRNMHYPTPQVVSELRLQLPELLFNYGSSQAILDQKLAWFLQVPSRNVVALNGAAQFFPWAARRFAGKAAFVPRPTFGEWHRVVPDACAYRDDGTGVVHLPTEVPPGSVVVVVNPNNPTGAVTPTAHIMEFARAHQDCIVLVDESFIHFCDEESIIDSLESDPLTNVVVLQSLSKALGVPGVRIGFVYSQDTALLDALRSDLPIWNMNSVAEKFVELLLKNRTALQESFSATIEDRGDLATRLRRVPGVKCVSPSGGNFLLVELAVDAATSARLADALLAREGFYVKDVSAKFDDGRGRWRLAVRTPADHALLVTAMTNLAIVQ